MTGLYRSVDVVPEEIFSTEMDDFGTMQVEQDIAMSACDDVGLSMLRKKMLKWSNAR